MVKWAEKTGVDRIVFHSATGAGDSAGLLRADLPEDSRKRYADRTRAEEILAEADVEYAVLRTYIVRPETEPATGKAFVSTDHTVTGSVSRADLAILTLYCSDGPRCRNQILHASTNDDWTFQRPE